MSRGMGPTRVIDNTQKQQQDQGSVLGDIFQAVSPFLPPPIALVGNAAFGALHGKDLSSIAMDMGKGLLMDGLGGEAPPVDPSLQDTIANEATDIAKNTALPGVPDGSGFAIVPPTPGAAAADATKSTQGAGGALTGNPQIDGLLQEYPQLSQLFSDPGALQQVIRMLTYPKQ